MLAVVEEQVIVPLSNAGDGPLDDFLRLVGRLLLDLVDIGPFGEFLQRRPPDDEIVVLDDAGFPVIDGVVAVEIPFHGDVAPL